MTDGCRSTGKVHRLTSRFCARQLVGKNGARLGESDSTTPMPAAWSRSIVRSRPRVARTTASRPSATAPSTRQLTGREPAHREHDDVRTTLLDLAQGRLAEHVARAVRAAELGIELRDVGHRAAALRPDGHRPATLLAGRDHGRGDGSADRVAEHDDPLVGALVGERAAVPRRCRGLLEPHVAAHVLERSGVARRRFEGRRDVLRDRRLTMPVPCHRSGHDVVDRLGLRRVRHDGDDSGHEGGTDSEAEGGTPHEHPGAPERILDEAVARDAEPEGDSDQAEAHLHRAGVERRHADDQHRPVPQIDRERQVADVRQRADREQPVESCVRPGARRRPAARRPASARRRATTGMPSRRCRTRPAARRRGRTARDPQRRAPRGSGRAGA